jgi:BASS family bile acid:Na+ symporter
MEHSLTFLDSIRLDFNPASLHALNIALAIVMFGVALEIKPEHFKKLLSNPKSALVGVASQFFLLPFLTFLLTLILHDYLSPTMALGMVLVAACPGGNISNFISSLSKGNIALSVSLTAISTMGAVIFTPLNFTLWGKLVLHFYHSHNASSLLPALEIDFFQMFKTVLLILGIPIVLGIFTGQKFPVLTKKILKPVKTFSIIIFTAIVIMALAKNFDHFLTAIQYIFFIVLIHNALAFASGYFLASLLKLPLRDRKTISIETGIQNSGLALVLIFNPKIFPPDLQLGGMAVIAAWWGIWHIVSGIFMAGIWTHFTFGIFSGKTVKIDNGIS